MSFTLQLDAEIIELTTLIGAAQKTAWVGALSFEDRCTGSLTNAHTHDVRFSSCILLNYPTTVYPAKDDSEARQQNLSRIQGLYGKVELRQIEPYSFAAMQSLVTEILQIGFDFVAFDITCMTKVHALAVAAELAKHSPGQWVAAYSLPENYGTLESKRRWTGWRDVIVAPLADTATLMNEAHSRGLIIPGHEADRLIVALAELQPAGGLILLTQTPRRPDLRQISEQHNRKIIRQLTRMRSSSWEEKAIGVLDYQNLKESVLSQVNIARKYSAPVVLFPYGAKSLAFSAALLLALEYPDASWFVYPIPSSYDISYSDGIEKTLWLIPSLSAA